MPIHSKPLTFSKATNTTDDSSLMIEKILNFFYQTSLTLDTNEHLELYSSPDFSPYFAKYVRMITNNQHLTTKKAISLLNEDFIRDAQAQSMPPIARKNRSLSKSHEIFENVYAYTQLALIEKYRVTNFKELLEFENPEAQKLVLWARGMQSNFDLIHYSLENDKNYSKTVSVSGKVIDSPLSQQIFCRLIEKGFSPTTAKGVELASSGGIAALACLSGIQLEILLIGEHFSREADLKLAKNCGFNDFAEMQNYINSKLGMYTQEQKSELLLSFRDEAQQVLAEKFGFNNIEEAMDEAIKNQITLTNMPILAAYKQLNELYDARFNNLITKYGFEDYANFVANYQNLNKRSKLAFEKELNAMYAEANEIQDSLSSSNGHSFTYNYFTQEWAHNLYYSAMAIDWYFENKAEAAAANKHLAFGDDGIAEMAYDNLINKYGIELANKKLGFKEVYDYNEIADSPHIDHAVSVIGGTPPTLPVLGGLVRIAPYLLKYKKQIKDNQNNRLQGKIDTQKQEIGSTLKPEGPERQK